MTRLQSPLSIMFVLLLLSATSRGTSIPTSQIAPMRHASKGGYFAVHSDSNVNTQSHSALFSFLPDHYREHQVGSGDSDTNSSIASPSPSTSQSPVPLGYLYDPCLSDSDCVGPRTCVLSQTNGPCRRASPCYCLEPVPPSDFNTHGVPDGATKVFIFQQCTQCSECELAPNETCLVPRSASPGTDGICGSLYPVALGILSELGCDSFPNVTPLPHSGTASFGCEGPSCNNVYKSPTSEPSPSTTPSETPSETPSATSSPSSTSISTPLEEEGCIDIALLGAFQKHQRVYSRDWLAKVLCDAHGSCATPGHIAVYGGRPVTMKTYCENIASSCSLQVRRVNSPKYEGRNAVRVSSNTPGLVFTPLSARHASSVEEHFLRLLIRAGW